MIERWELLQAQRFEGQADDQQDQQKLNSDLCDVTSWLGRVQPELERLQSFTPATSMRDFKVNIGKLKVRNRESKIPERLQSGLVFSCFRAGDAEKLRQLQMSDDRRQPGQSQRPAGRAAGRRGLGQSELGAGVLQPGKLGDEAARRRPAVSGQRAPAAGRRQILYGERPTPSSLLLLLQEFHETLHSLLVWLAQAESKLSALGADPAAEQRDALAVRPYVRAGVPRLWRC